MKTLSALAPIVILIVFFLLIGKFNISFKPFSMHLPQWFRAVGYLFFTIGLIIVVTDTAVEEHHKGVMEGIDRSYESIHKVLDDTLGKSNIDAVKAAEEEAAKGEK